MSLDTATTEISYLLGRAFAVAEYVQGKAVPHANATVRDKFFSAASTTPSRIFPVLLRNMQHGLSKIRKENKGLYIVLDNMIQNIVNSIEASTGFPSSLSLEKQAQFMLGYYQQRQALFTKKETATEDNTEK